MDKYTLIVESINLLEERRKPRKKPAFYYYRLKNLEKDLKVKYKKGLELERNERDGTKKFKIRLKNQRLKARIDQIHYQIIDKKRLKNLQTY